MIQGSFSKGEAEDLATLLTAGSLAPGVKIVEEHIIGPDQIDAAK